MALDGILFKYGFVHVKRHGGDNIPSPSLSLFSKGENTIKSIDLEVVHIERGSNLQLHTS
jgi:hypothetical protein